MGNETSQANKQTYAKMFDTLQYTPITSQRTEANYSSSFKPDLIQDRPTQLMNTAYYGKWSMHLSNGISPTPRIGQCHVYDPVTDSIVIAYGSDPNSVCLNDCWALNLGSMKWRIINRQLHEPRQYCSACLMGRNMVIFGGTANGQFFSDLHYINLDDGSVHEIPVTGTLPAARTNPALFASDRYLFLWAGYDGRIHNGLYRIDITEGVWQKASTSQTGIAAPAFCFYQGKYFIFGSSGTPMSTFDPTTCHFEPFPCTGTEPSANLPHATLISGDEYIFLVGGESSQRFMHIFALDVKRHWWFAFHVRPDNNTLSISDGIVNNSGLFMLPREHSTSAVYSPAQRALVSVMGSRFHEPAPIFKISVDTALAFCHARSDLYEMYHFTNP
ncbi:Kelch motif family protein [Histomonas meleagridis]|uniref:Kelch motif family protein n=1 Tax=Histomonas meleagridis TaxID=135588 RepID=UPI00355A4051|nr:Kelch motif family protein [Histomonas meleagridis]KAH0800072.1 Kelch motif family protein [Histomonas meleagridis]